MKRVLSVAIICMVVFSAGAYAQDDASGIKKAAEFLFSKQNDDGSFGESPHGRIGISALVLHALAESPVRNEAVEKKALEYILAHVQEDGGVYSPKEGLQNYTTSIALMAFVAMPEGSVDSAIIKAAQNFTLGMQCEESKEFNEKEHKTYGGFGYGSSMRADLSNTQFALDALHASKLPKNHPAYKKALIFISRCQNRAESNDQEWSSVEPDGGFVYHHNSSAIGTIKTASGQEIPRTYGSMTYAGYKSMIYAGLKKDDPRVMAAFKWIGENYSLTENPHAGQTGLFYYYHTMAKALVASGEKEIIDAEGVSHNWAKELTTQLLSTQAKDGSWVNMKDRWYEGSPTLVTAYVLNTLVLCEEATKE